jgi:hypothetical protein
VSPDNTDLPESSEPSGAAAAEENYMLPREPPEWPPEPYEPPEPPQPPQPSQPPAGPPAQGNDMQPGEVLYPNQFIRSTFGRYALWYQRDGNLVLYDEPNNRSPLWNSETAGSRPGFCIMQHDGNLVIYNSVRQHIWASNTYQYPGSRLVVQDDGDVVIYAQSDIRIWATNTVKQEAVYSFLPWLRRGMSVAITSKLLPATDKYPQRYSQRGEAYINLTVDVGASESDTHPEPVTTKVALYGPGDITSLDPSVVIRTQPVNNSIDFESNLLPFIEFAQPDFPWRYTPEAPKGQTLRPWIFLIVLSDDGTEYDKVSIEPNKPLPYITVIDRCKLPNPGQIWAWAHVQVLNKINGEKISDELKKRPSDFVSRIICPRKLKPNQSYTAFLVPTFETGRLAGLGEKIGEGVHGLKSAWPWPCNEGSIQPPVSIQLPFYYSFKFKTGAGDDFESLVGKLDPRQMPEGVGIKDIDVTNPGYNLPSASASGEILGLEGALKAVSTQPTTANGNNNNEMVAEQFKKALMLILNAAAQGVPKVAPPIYGCWHAQASTVVAENSQRWIDDLNLDPRNRIAAGLGTLVVRKEQDKLMASAWKQLPDIQRINQTLRQAELAMEVSGKNMDKINALPIEDAITLATPVHAKVLVKAASKTIAQNFKESIIPEALLSPTFKQIIRSMGPVRKRQRMVNLTIKEEQRRGQSIITEKKIEEGDTSALLKENSTIDETNIDNNTILTRINGGELIAAPERTDSDKMAKIDSLVDSFVNMPESPGSSEPQTRDSSEQYTRLDYLEKFIKYRHLANPFYSYKPGEKEFQQVAEKLIGKIKGESHDDQPNKKRVEINQIHSIISEALDPSKTIAADLRSRLKVMHSSNWDLQDPVQPIMPIMAHPTFPQPMFEALKELSQDYILPGLDKIPPNTIGLLVSNQKFIEAYMVGLNHEMSRELLWREFPTDRGGSYFRQFWDIRGSVEINEPVPEKMKDIEEIHRWQRDSKLGEHSPRNISDPNEAQIILVIRGDLLKRYPNSVIYAIRAYSGQSSNNRKEPIFHGLLYPDVTFFAFDLTVGKAKSEGWYVVIQEQPSEPRFGLDAENPDPTKVGEGIAEWDKLSWSSIAKDKNSLDKLVNIDLDDNVPKVSNNAGVAWGENSSNMAYILLQKPILIAILAKDLLPPQNTGGP